MRVLSNFAILVLAVVFCVVAVAASAANAYSFSSFHRDGIQDPTPSNLPTWCNGINCPLFSTVANCTTSQGSFAIRQYPSYQWVTWATNGTQLDYNNVGDEAFQHLFQYISGQNVNNEKIDMTAPVTTNVLSGAGPNCASFFNVSFFIPYKWQGKAPTPTGDGVFLSYTPPMTVAVEVFGGYADNWNDEVVPRAKALAAQITAAGITPIYNNQEVVAQYDSPFRFFDRHNEIWFQIPDGTTCNSQANKKQ